MPKQKPKKQNIRHATDEQIDEVVRRIFEKDRQQQSKKKRSGK
jgi:hypothetical protein